jgi:SAM-dependent methyltransferase
MEPRETYNSYRKENEKQVLDKLLSGILSGSIKKTRYLDVGGGDGNLTNVIKDILNPEETFLVDVQFAKSYENITLWTPTELAESSIQIDVVSFMMSIHHFVDDTLLTALSKVRPGGYVIIKDHNVEDPSQARFIQAIHAIYAVGNNETLEHFHHRYHSLKSMESYLEKLGLQICSSIKPTGVQQKYYILAQVKRQIVYDKKDASKFPSVSCFIPSTNFQILLNNVTQKNHLTFLHRLLLNVKGKEELTYSDFLKLRNDTNFLQRYFAAKVL